MARRKKQIPRKLAQSADAFRLRLQYVCDALFSGDVTRFAHTISVNSAHLKDMLRAGSRRPSAGMLSQVALYTGAQSSWLLTGQGPPFVPELELETCWPLPAELRSAFVPVPAAALSGLPFVRPRAVSVSAAPETTPPAEVYTAAQLIYQAHVAASPVVFGLGGDAAGQAGVLSGVCRLVEQRYLTSLALTATAVSFVQPRSVISLDMGGIAKLAAQNGCGFGEALARWRRRPQWRKNVVATAWAARLPVTVHAEIGESIEHFQPHLRGAEMGACLGAALYVDLLIFVEQLRRLAAAPAGVLVLAGEVARWLRLTQFALHALTAPEPTWSVVVLGATTAVDEAWLAQLKAPVVCVPGQYVDLCQQLNSACEQAYLGKTNDAYNNKAGA